MIIELNLTPHTVNLNGLNPYSNGMMIELAVKMTRNDTLFSLNPYSNGMIIEPTDEAIDWLRRKYSLNPYSNGMMIELFYDEQKDMMWVLILILME